MTMPKFLRDFLFQLLSRPIVRAVQWTPAERDAFDLFCRSSCGAKLFEYLRQVVATTTFAAVYRQSVSANFHARGQQDVLLLLHRLRVFPAKQEESAFDGLSDTEPAHQVESRTTWRYNGGRGAIG
jgi:hypothetical protein